MSCQNQSELEVNPLCFPSCSDVGAEPRRCQTSAFTIAFLTFGILNFAILLAFIRSTALEAVKERYKARERRTLERIKTRHSAIVNNYSKRGAFMIYVTCGLWRPKNEVKDDPIASETKETRSDWGPDGKYAYEKKIEELNSEQRLEFRSQVILPALLSFSFTNYLHTDSTPGQSACRRDNRSHLDLATWRAGLHAPRRLVLLDRVLLLLHLDVNAGTR